MSEFNYDYNLLKENKTEEKERLTEIKTYEYGVRFLDDATGGFGSQELILLCSKSGKGKSHLCSLIAEHNAKAGRKVLYLALEADDKEILRRIKFRFCCKRYFNDYDSLYPLSYNKWLLGKLEDKLSRYYKEFDNEVKKWGENLIIRYREKEFNKNSITTNFMSYAHEVDLIILDHLHYIDFDNDNENRALKEIVETIRENNLTFKVPLLLVAHLRKSDIKNPTLVPDMEDVSGSKHIINIAKTIITMSPKQEFIENNPAITKTHMHIAKGRYLGSTNCYIAELYFNSKTETYEDTYTLGKAGEYVKKFELAEIMPDWYSCNKGVKSETHKRLYD